MFFLVFFEGKKTIIKKLLFQVDYFFIRVIQILFILGTKEKECPRHTIRTIKYLHENDASMLWF